MLSLALTAPGCASVGAKPAWLRNAVRDRVDRFESVRGLNEPSYGLLSRQGLLYAARHEPDGAAASLEARLRAHPEPAGTLALAEVTYRAGLARERSDPDGALDRFRDAAVLAAISLSKEDGPSLEAAAEVHNRALARVLRLAQRPDVRRGRTWQETLAGHGLVAGAAAPVLDPARFAVLTVADDLLVGGMQHVYKAGGVGVPVVADRVVDRDKSADPQESYYPVPLRLGATAVVVPGAGSEWRRAPASLDFRDAFDDGPVRLAGRSVPLAHDRTSALVLHADRSLLTSLEYSGLFRASFGGEMNAGIYMLRPYQPGKIPVVLVHGLTSSPRAFVQTLNELSNDPGLSGRFQFWVFLYPTGLPIPGSAARLREALTRARETFDPGRADPAFDRTVLVGHSMGGLLSKAMVQDTGMALWDATMAVPVDRLVAPPGVREQLTEALVFRPVPFVRRVVFIATPHRGSNTADRLFGTVVSRFIRGPSEQAEMVKELERLNGPEVMAREVRGANALDSVQELRTDSPVLRVLDRLPIDPSVPYHSIIPMIAERLGTDGLVPYTSAHLDGASSELIIPGTHSAQQTPAATDELRRILRVHLAEHGLL